MEEKENPPCVDSLAAETQGGLDDASGLPVRLNRYSRAHYRALDIGNHTTLKTILQGLPKN